MYSYADSQRWRLKRNIFSDLKYIIQLSYGKNAIILYIKIIFPAISKYFGESLR
jgi:hypothetical protein